MERKPRHLWANTLPRGSPNAPNLFHL
jgi:hypothetical protein